MKKKPQLNAALLDLHTDILPCLQTQNRVYGPFDYPFLREHLQATGARRVLDIGTADGSFLRGLARQLPQMHFHGIDANRALIQRGQRSAARAPECNLSLTEGFFDRAFSPARYDCIMARFALEHVAGLKNCLAAMAVRLAAKGTVAIVEYYVDTTDIEDPVWRAFRERELQLYRTVRSHPRLALQLPAMLTAAGFIGARTSLHVVSPATVGWERFAALVEVYARTYARIDRVLWSPPFVRKVHGWLQNGARAASPREPSFLISHTIASKR